MARTALTPVQLTTRDTGGNLGVGATPDATNGNIVAGPIGAWHLAILVLNADSRNHSLHHPGVRLCGCRDGIGERQLRRRPVPAVRPGERR